MPNLEQTEAWAEILRLRDTLSLRELAQRFSTTPGQISAALTRVGMGSASRDAAATDEDELPPEAGAADEPEDDEALGSLQQARQGSKDFQISQHAALLGQLPDAEVARRAGVSIRTIASFRARHNIPGYRGPRRTSRHRGQPQEPAQPEAAPIHPGPRETEARRAWQVVWRDARGEHRGVLLATDLVAAASQARETVQGEIIGLMLVGTFL